MKKIKSFGVLFVFLLTLVACKEKKANKELSQMEQVMAIHDEVMPKMGTVGRLATRLKSKVNDPEMGEKYRKAKTDLEGANEAMMDWMKGFGDRFEPSEIVNGAALSAEKQKFLDEEELKIKAVRNKINSSIKNAQELLNQ